MHILASISSFPIREGSLRHLPGPLNLYGSSEQSSFFSVQVLACTHLVCTSYSIMRLIDIVGTAIVGSKASTFSNLQVLSFGWITSFLAFKKPHR